MAKKKDLPKGGNDPYLAVTIHSYDPWNCCSQGGTMKACYEAKGSLPTFDRVDKGQAYDVGWDEIADWATKKNIPVHWGEFGIGREHDRDQASREDTLIKDYYTTQVREALKRNMSSCAWDDQGWFQVIGNDLQWKYGLKDAMMKGKKEAGGNPGSNEGSKNKESKQGKGSKSKKGSNRGGCCPWNGTCGKDAWCNESPENCGKCHWQER